MLRAVAAKLGAPCYCIPYAHLAGFYGQIGFRQVDPGETPDFLAARLADDRFRGDGQEYLLMYRPGP
jgi:hypothetical protein